jgi:hypothetical protein
MTRPGSLMCAFRTEEEMRASMRRSRDLVRRGTPVERILFAIVDLVHRLGRGPEGRKAPDRALLAR